MGVEHEIREKLDAAFSPRLLSVTDESEQHRGHAGWREGGETHFRVEIASDDFAKLSRIERHRAVHRALGSDLVGRIHALALQIEA
ncbi:BolA family protein [Roseitranquillus sediminis]|uniref:BolA family protein n=1 Tax=Roseitranquillus sediminis TaxID=2809051 RepID=UPI001D0C6BC4|nr:BolA family protein [Roseitranquillus sediminis]MBM9594626.1 BolA family transcriptional regulator [Roseitranquillus sediminis]